MAGVVKAARQISIDGTLVHVRPDICPVEALNRTMPACAIVGEVAGHYNLCPFMYGLRIFRGGTVYDVRATANMPAWLTAHHRDGDRYEVLCLRKESHATEVGARLRP